MNKNLFLIHKNFEYVDSTENYIKKMFIIVFQNIYNENKYSLKLKENTPFFKVDMAYQNLEGVMEEKDNAIKYDYTSYIYSTFILKKELVLL